MNCEKGQYVYPEVLAPSLSNKQRQQHRIYEEVPVSDRSYTSSSFLTEPDQIREEVRIPEENDLLLNDLNENKQNLKKWQRALRTCSGCLKVLALIFMSLAAYHLIFPVKLDKIGGHHGKWQPHHGRGLRGFREENGDLDFFAAYRFAPNPPPSASNAPTATLSSAEGTDSSQIVDKRVLQERKITRIMTRATFVTFLMWALVFAAAAVGYRTSKQNQLNQVSRCTFKKSILLLVFATALGIWKLSLDFKLEKQMRRYLNTDAGKETAPWKKNEGKRNRRNWNFQDQANFDNSENQIIWSRKDSHRHLSEVKQGRRLRSAFDVFDFVNNAITSGVNKAKSNIDQVLGAIDKGTNKILDPIRQDVNRLIDEKILDPLAQKVKEQLEKANTNSYAETKTQEVAVPAEDDNTHVLQSSHIDINVQDPVQTTEIIAEPVIAEEVIEETVRDEMFAEPLPCNFPTPPPPSIIEDVIEPVVFEPVVAEPIIDYLSLEEAEVIKHLASMGRLFNDEDEAKMIKLTEDLSAWMNKYAPTFDDPEFMLQQVAMTTSELTEASMQQEPPSAQPEENQQELIQVPAPAEMQTSFQVSFSFGDNADWFIFEQTVLQDETAVQATFDFNNLWAEMTRDIKIQEDWNRLDANDWNNLIQIQYLQDSEIDKVVDEWFGVESLAPVNVLEFTPEQIQQMFRDKTASEFKFVLDDINDFNRIIHVFEMLTEEQIFAYLTDLTECDWKMTTPDEWRALVIFLDSQGFKSIVDNMNADEILSVWNFFDDSMSQKFFNGLTKEDKINFTPAEWQASFVGFTPSEFKQLFFDEMAVNDILYVCQLLGDMDAFLQGLTIDDWRHFTPAEWEAFLADAEIKELIDFIHQMHSVEPKVVYQMFKNMPIEMVQDFVNAPELVEQFSSEELQTINRGARDNTSTTESVLDFEPVWKHQNRRRHGGEKKMDRRGKHHRDHERGRNGPSNKESHEKSNQKHNKRDRLSFEQRPKGEYINKAFSWIFDNEDFVINENQQDEDFDNVMDAIREAKVQGESDLSTREDSETDSESEQESQSDSEFESADSYSESESLEDRNLSRRGRNKRRQEKRLKHKQKLREKRQRRRERKRESKRQQRERQSQEEFLQLSEEETQILDLAILPQASIDRRHGGRHLDKEEYYLPHGRVYLDQDAAEWDHKANWDSQQNFESRRHHNGPPKRCMKWILALGALMFTTMIVSFTFIFGMFLYKFRSFNTLHEMHLQSSGQTVEERNKKYLQFTQASPRCTKAPQRKMSTETMSDAQNSLNFSACANRQGFNEAFGQTVIAEHMPNQLHDTENVPVPKHQPPQATYTLDQVKAVLALERERLGYH